MSQNDPQAVGAVVREILSSVGAHADLATVGDTDSLLGSGVLDSLAMVNLVTALEGRFTIAVHETELVPEHFDTIAAIVALVRGKLGAA